MSASAAIVRAAIHPAIGVARLGNSTEEYFLAPEVTDPLPERPGFYREAGSGALKRQAARFRVYGLDATGRAVVELTAANADIRWTAHLANKKAAWYKFELALDIPEAALAQPSERRNADISDRARLTIDPGSRQIAGRDQRGPQYQFDTGAFMGQAVYLGELRTDADGRLIVLGGRGKSASYNDARALTFANNEGWYDDIADGPVTAEVTFEGQPLPVDPAWIVVAPPNYAPMQKSVRTMWDLIRDVSISAGTLPKPARPSFVADIQPIFERLSRLQWVNQGFALTYGWGAAHNFSSPEMRQKLSRNDPDTADTRRVLANQFRVFDRDAWSPLPWPWLYGDAMSGHKPSTPRHHAALTDTQLAFLQQWATGDFDADYDPQKEPPRSLDDVPLAEQPATLDRASLEFCLADAFHPGCEMTWTMRNAGLYQAPFRIAHAPAGWVEPDYGPVMYPEIRRLPKGPILAGQLPGGLTRWMAVPWQTDTASCRSGYATGYDPYLPTFWPARVPNQVVTQDDYKIVMDQGQPIGDRLAAFARRSSWLTPLGGGCKIDQINNMIAHFDRMGIVEVRDGPGTEGLPAVLEVQDIVATPVPTALPGRAEDVDLSDVDKVRRFPQGLRS